MTSDLGRDDHGDAEPLVLLHGVATSRLIWCRVVEPLARGRRVIAVDVPGFGQSAPAGPGFELEQVADQLVDGLGLVRFDLVGHSLGGAVAVATAARHPEAVRRLVLVAPAGLAPRATAVAAALGAAAERAVYARRALGYQLVARARGRRAMFGATVADAGRMHPRDARLLLDASRGARRVSAGVRRALEADLRDDLAAARMPVGLIWGTADRVVPYSGLEALRRLRPDAVVETLPATGHIPQIEDPAAFVAALERILSAPDGAHPSVQRGGAEPA
jgi:pyruvate dehydrogenase E2 component (dihydrolipoamide acetyltransferase)